MRRSHIPWSNWSRDPHFKQFSHEIRYLCTSKQVKNVWHPRLQWRSHVSTSKLVAHWATCFYGNGKGGAQMVWIVLLRRNPSFSASSVSSAHSGGGQMIRLLSTLGLVDPPFLSDFLLIFFLLCLNSDTVTLSLFCLLILIWACFFFSWCLHLLDIKKKKQPDRGRRKGRGSGNQWVDGCKSCCAVCVGDWPQEKQCVVKPRHDVQSDPRILSLSIALNIGLSALWPSENCKI